MKKKTLGLLLAALMVLTSLWLPASLGGIREAEADDYLSQCTKYKTNLVWKIKDISKGLKMYSEPRKSSSVEHDLSYDDLKGMTFRTYNITTIYKNTLGEYWYLAMVQTSPGVRCGGYVFSGDGINTFKSLYANGLTLNDTVAPTTLAQGSGFHISGTITSEYMSINSVRAVVYEAGTANVVIGDQIDEGIEVISSSGNVNGYSYSLNNSSVDNNLKFGSLPVGNYQYGILVECKVYAVDYSGLISFNVTYALHLSDFSVYDKNEGKTPTVTFNADGGSVSPSSKTVSYGSTYGTLPTPARSGFTFDGWYTAASGGTKVTSSTTVTNGSNHTLYAHWTKQVAVYLDYMWTPPETSIISVTYGKPYGNIFTPYWRGYEFLGWYTAATGGSKITEETMVTNSEEHTLYAHWAAGQYTVTFDANGGSVSPASITVTTGTAYGTLPTPTHSDSLNNFLGWYTEREAGNRITADTIVDWGDDHTLYAHWTKNAVITFDANGGTLRYGSFSQTKEYGVPLTLSSDIPTWERGYFRGWALSPTAATAEYQPGDTYTREGNATLYAVWEAKNVYHVTFYPNYVGGGNPVIREKIEGVWLSYSISRSDGFYDLLGWATNPNATTPKYTASFAQAMGELPVYSFSYTEDKDATLYAVWAPRTPYVSFAVSLKYNLSSNAQKKEYHPDDYYDMRLGKIDYKAYSTEEVGKTPRQLGWPLWDEEAFFGSNSVWYYNLLWKYSYDGSNYSILTPDTPLQLGIRIILEKVRNSYRIKYDGNGGSGAPDNQLKTYGVSIQLRDETPKRTGYTFLGWATTADATQAEYAPRATYSADLDITLYAVWEVSTYTITLNPNGGSVSPTIKTVTYGQAYGTLPTPTRTGYTFAGWWTAKDTGGKQVTASTVCYASGNYTLYARWAPKTYTVTLNPNGGTCGTSTKTVTYGQAYGALPTPTRSGYTFDGWYTAKTGGKKVTASTVCYATGDYTLYARWTSVRTYTVTLNPNGGTCGTGSKTVTYGQAYGTMPVPTRKGYTFAGWWTAKTGGKKVTASTICYASGNYTLYARWTEGYTMTFNPNGGTVSPTTKVVKYGQQYGALPTPTRAGYTFAGWWTAKTGGKQVTASTVCYASAGYTLYARWTAKKFVVTLNPNGGECATATKTVTYGQAYGTMPVPSPRTGYTFAGWYTAKTGGKKVTATTVCYATGNYTLYARWTPKTYTVTLNPNGGSCSTATKKVTYGQTYGTLPVPTRSGYVFAGWWTAKTGGKQVTATTTCYATGNYTLYARWWQN